MHQHVNSLRFLNISFLSSNSTILLYSCKANGNNHFVPCQYWKHKVRGCKFAAESGAGSLWLKFLYWLHMRTTIMCFFVADHNVSWLVWLVPAWTGIRTFIFTWMYLFHSNISALWYFISFLLELCNLHYRHHGKFQWQVPSAWTPWMNDFNFTAVVTALAQN